MEAKETYYKGKRELLYRQKRPEVRVDCETFLHSSIQGLFRLGWRHLYIYDIHL